MLGQEGGFVAFCLGEVASCRELRLVVVVVAKMVEYLFVTVEVLVFFVMVEGFFFFWFSTRGQLTWL